MKLALAIPHLPDGGARDESLARLLRALDIRRVPGVAVAWGDAPARAGLERYGEFTDKLPNHEWAFRVWTWFASLDTEWSIQLQDDTITPEANAFWPILRAQLIAAPGDVVGLATVHPRAPWIMKSGRRWFRTRAWSIGWGVAYRTKWIRDVLLPWRERVLEHALTSNEDSFVNDCVVAHSGSVYHPVPSLVDHDLTIPSTYNSVDDGHRRATTQWDDLMPTVPGAGLHDDVYIRTLSDPDFWRPREATELLPFPEKNR